MQIRHIVISIAVVLFVIWTVVALQWQDMGCDLGESYPLALQHGTPDILEVLVYCEGD